MTQVTLNRDLERAKEPKSTALLDRKLTELIEHNWL